MSRRASRKKTLSSAEARRRPSMTSGPKLGRYRVKHPTPIPRPGQRARRGVGVESAPLTRTGAYRHDFMVFCIKHLLNTTDLLIKERRNSWRLAHEVAGVGYGESFPSLDACANAIVSALEHLYAQESEEEAA